jgi:UDP-3-O-[3-hydroxymyristoyl] glucosamine N-acyltransferase
VIEHDVEIGANSCVDRAKLGTTLVGAGTKIDNLVQIGHNCRVGRCCILCGQSGLAGSVTLGDGVVLGGRVAVSDGVSIGSGAKIGGMSGVASDVPPGQIYMGTPAGPATEWRRTYAALRRLGKGRTDVKGE